MYWKDFGHRALVAAIVLLNVGLDQFTKKMVRMYVADHEQIRVISDRITLTRVENSGAFLSLGDAMHDTWKLLVLVLMPVAVLVGGLYFVLSRKQMPLYVLIGICCVIGGGAGNLYDRIVYGSVTDFLHIDFGLFQTGVFNFADMSIMLGMGLILVNSVLKREQADGVYV